jgi:hypothetical protein
VDGKHPFIVYADDNLLENDVNTIKKNIEIILYADKEVCLGINTEN